MPLNAINEHPNEIKGKTNDNRLNCKHNSSRMSPKSVFIHSPRIFSIIVIGLGVVVMLGWVLDTRILVQLFDHFVPMQFNTALLFVLGGLGLKFANRRHLKTILTSTILIVSTCTLIQYVGGYNFGIDELFWKHQIRTLSSHPGRMAPITAVAFLLVSLALLSGKGKFRTLSVAGMLGSLVFGLGFSSLLAYAFNVDKIISWGLYTPMAVNTAFGLSALGAALAFAPIKISSSAAERNGQLYGYGLSLVLGCFLVDISTPWFASATLVYVLLVTFCWFIEESHRYKAFIASVLTAVALGYLLKSNFSFQYSMLVNSIFSMLLIWAMGKIIFSTKQAKAKEERLRKMLGKEKRVMHDLNTQLKTQNEELENYVYLASHDLKSPLKSIMLLSKMLTESKDMDSDVKKEALRLIGDSAERMEALVSGILDVSRVGVEQDTEIVSCERLIMDTIQDLRSLMMERKVVIYLAGAFPVLYAKEMELHMVFQNLITNAIKYQPKNRIPTMIIKCTSKQDLWEFSISDNGMGIPDNKLNEVFGMFKRLHNYQSIPGSGIGLAHCKKIIESHGGSISVESKLDKGTTFNFTIPKHKDLPLQLIHTTKVQMIQFEPKRKKLSVNPIQLTA